MSHSQKYPVYTTSSPPEPIRDEIPDNSREKPDQLQPDVRRPYKPDWLVVLISVLVFITMLIAILFNIFGF